MTSAVKRWFLSLVVLIVTVAITSYVVIVLRLGSVGESPRVGDWLVLGLMLATSISITNVIWNRLSRSAAAMNRELQRLGTDRQRELSRLEERTASEGIDPELNRSLTATRGRFEALWRERDELGSQKRQVERRREQLESILYAIPEAVMVTDSEQRVVLANRAAETLFGLSEHEAGSKKVQECIQDKRFLSLLNEARQAATHKVAEYWRGSWDNRRWYNAVVSPIRNGTQDGARGVLAILHDVTKEKAAARMKTDFVSNISHELRTPLSSIRGYLEILVDGEVDDEEVRQKFYDVMQNEADRLSHLVDNILSISRIAAGAGIKKQSLPFGPVVKEVLKVLEPQALINGVELRDEVMPLFISVDMDKDMMAQAVCNLISNALKYTPVGGQVRVSLGVDESAGEVRVEVSDTGIGIGEKDQERIFNKFYRVPSSQKMAKGAGLGLALVKDIVETVHNGRLAVSSAVGEGSVFSLILPVSECASKLEVLSEASES